MNDLFGDLSKMGNGLNLNPVTMIQLVIMILLLLFINSLLQYIFSKVKWKSGRGQTMQTVMSSIVKYGSVLVGFFWGLAILGVNVSTIFASVGILALIVSFGAESLIADVVTGLFMLFENQYRTGDILEVNGFRGTVTNITIRTTSITDVGQNVKIFNNSDMRNIVNLSDSLSSSICDISIPYATDLRKFRELIEKLLPEIQKDYAEVMPETPIYKGVQELADSAVIIRIVAKVQEENRFNVVRILNEELKTRLEENGISIPFPQVVVHKED